MNNLKTIANYAKKNHVTASYIYKLIRDGWIKPVVIDGVKFIDIDKYPSINGLK